MKNKRQKSEVMSNGSSFRTTQRESSESRKRIKEKKSISRAMKIPF